MIRRWWGLLFKPCADLRAPPPLPPVAAKPDGGDVEIEEMMQASRAAQASSLVATSAALDHIDRDLLSGKWARRASMRMQDAMRPRDRDPVFQDVVDRL